LKLADDRRAIAAVLVEYGIDLRTPSGPALLERLSYRTHLL
jgi:hypothetical protein